MPISVTKIFVYGTLKRGGSNHPLLTGQHFLGETRTAGGYQLYSLGEYPAMVRSADVRHDVTGEVWAVDAACLTKLDALEGIAEGLYERVPIKLAPPFADRSVQTYLYLRSLEGQTSLGSTWKE